MGDEKHNGVDLETLLKACNTPMFRKWDGNGGHTSDWASIKYVVVGGLLLAALTSIGTSVINRVWNTADLKKSIEKVEDSNKQVWYKLDDLVVVNNEQTERLNVNTEVLFAHIHKPLPAPIERTKRGER